MPFFPKCPIYLTPLWTLFKQLIVMKQKRIFPTWRTTNDAILPWTTAIQSLCVNNLSNSLTPRLGRGAISVSDQRQQATRCRYRSDQLFMHTALRSTNSFIQQQLQHFSCCFKEKQLPVSSPLCYPFTRLQQKKKQQRSLQTLQLGLFLSDSPSLLFVCQSF